MFYSTPLAPPDAIFAVNTAFNTCPSPLAINVGVGAYRTNSGDPLVLDAVAEARKQLWELPRGKGGWQHEYLPIGGDEKFLRGSRKLLFGVEGTLDNEIANEKEMSISSIQTLSGTGALKLLAEFCSTSTSSPVTIAVPNPTWGNHKKIFSSCGSNLTCVTYTYLNLATPSSPSIDFPGVVSSLSSLDRNTLVLFHMCAHNPSGVDFSREEVSERESESESESESERAL